VNDEQRPEEPPAEDEARVPPPDETGGRSVGSRLMAEISGVGVDWRTALLVPALAVLTALIVSAFIIAVTDVDVLRLWGSEPGEAWSRTWHTIRDAYWALFQGSFGGLRAVSETLTASAPLILAGLAVGIGFRAGLFNIGAEGQMLMGGVFAVTAGFAFSGLPVFIHLPIVILAGFIGGAIWGGIPGILRAKTGAHEVIVTIMLNNIAIRLLDWLLKTSWLGEPTREDPISKAIEVSGRMPRLLGFLEDVRPASDIRVHAGILFAFLVAAGIYWLLYRSTLGYEFRAVGYNPHAAKYGGMNVTWLYFAVMAIAGGMAGLAGMNQVSGVLYRATPGFSAGIGFEAISLALLGRSHPGGIVLAGILFGALRAGGQQMQVATDVPIDLILVVQALVVVFIAAPALIRAIYRVRTGEAAEQLTKGWAT
jgi:simple sugar transport system permease protein